MPECRFPAGVFFPEDETRVGWLRLEDEALVLKPMASPFKESARLSAPECPGTPHPGDEGT